MEPKIAAIRTMIDDAGLADSVDLEVDGGIGPATIAGAASAGANVLIAGSALYKDPQGLEHAVADLRSRAEAARSAPLSPTLLHPRGEGLSELETPHVLIQPSPAGFLSTR